MKPNLENWSIVIIGSWNTRIFNPRWIAEKLFEDPGLKVQALIPIVPGFPTILSANDIEILPADDSLTFRAKNATDDVVLDMEKKAVGALRVLDHTPVRAIGVNFGFVETPAPPSTEGIFNTPEDEKLMEAGLKPTQHQLSRALQMEPGVLNLILTRSAENLKIATNFHLRLDYPAQLENAGQAADFIRGKVLSYKEKALLVLRDIYGLELEKEEVPV